MNILKAIQGVFLFALVVAAGAILIVLNASAKLAEEKFK
jgi:hypothetical protein